MGSAFGKSTVVPVMTARMWGVNILFFCSMTACRAGGPATGPLILSAEITTPEKSFFRLTESMRESRSITVPDSEAEGTLAAGRLQNARLEQISERQIIMIVQTKYASQVLR